MQLDVTQGNAITDGKSFNQWFVGNIRKWSKLKRLDIIETEIGLRNSDKVEIKWGNYKKLEQRTTWAGCRDKTAISILMSGNFAFSFRNPNDHSDIETVLLHNVSDYVIWKETSEHTWKANEDSIVITLKW